MMTSNHDQEQAERATDQSSPEPARKRVRVGYVLALMAMLAMYVAGFYSRPLLFGGKQDTPAASNVVQADAPACDEPAPDLQDLSITEAYQVLAREMSNLGHRDCAAPELEAKLAALEEEIAQLSTLNPYYRFKEIQAEAIPAGVPDIYGAALDVSLETVQASMNTMSKLDPTYGRQKIVLKGADLERYTQVGSATACLYCCDARTLVKPDGVAACGCAHSQAMRGLAAYLITNNPGDYTDEELVQELNRWRAVFFPKQTLTQALTERRDAGEAGIEEILQEFPEFMPQMVGDC